MHVIETMLSYVEIIIFAVVGTLAFLAIMRLVVLRKKAKIKPVGFFKDLPSSVTGMNKKDDL